MHQFLATLLLLIATALPASAQIAQPLPDHQAFELSLETDGEQLDFLWEIEPGYYMYREYLSLDGPSGAKIETQTDPGQRLADPTFGDTEVYYDGMIARVDRAALGNSGEFALTYQGCQDGGICYPPITRTFDVSTLQETTPAMEAPSAPSAASSWLSLGSGSGASQSAPVTVMAQASGSDATAPSSSNASPGIVLDESAGGGMITSLLSSGGLPLLLGSFVLFGIALAFTPCVFPMYPILAGALARDGEQLSTGRGFALSFTYVLAMASAFGLLGVVAAWSGQNLQLALQSPIAIGLVSALFVALALSMFGLFELRLPATWTNRIASAGGGKRGSFPSTAFLGFTSALIVGPCVTAPLAGALLYIAQTGSVTVGAAALFALGIGKGIPLVLFGTFGAGAMPRAGAWMVTVNRIFGFVFLASAIYMLSRVVPGSVTLALWSALFVAAGVFLGAFDTLGQDSRPARRLGKAFGVLALLYGGILAGGAAAGGSDPLRPFHGIATRAEANAGSQVRTDAPQTVAFDEASTMNEIARAVHTGGNGTLVYFTADWCIICRSIERNLFDDPEIARELNQLNAIKVDVTKVTAEDRAVMQALRVAGPPTMVFLDPQGREPVSSRFVGEPTKDDLLKSSYRTRGIWR